MATPTGIACAFMQHGCDHQELFQPLYLRTNRTNHTKIMRCFPHCCPEHRERSYCGSSIVVRVDPAPPQVIDATALHVYGRFRPIDSPPAVVLGQNYSLGIIAKGLQRQDPSTGEWIESKQLMSAADEDLRFELNPGGRWYYPWSGVATIAMRNKEHVLEVFVFVATGYRDELVLAATTASPEFRLMSFRRGATMQLTPPNANSDDYSKSPCTKRGAQSTWETGQATTATRTATPSSPASPPRAQRRLSPPIEPLSPSSRSDAVAKLQGLLVYVAGHSLRDVGYEDLLRWEQEVGFLADSDQPRSPQPERTDAQSLDTLDVAFRLLLHLWLRRTSPTMDDESQRPTPAPVDFRQEGMTSLWERWIDVVYDDATKILSRLEDNLSIREFLGQWTPMSTPHGRLSWGWLDLRSVVAHRRQDFIETSTNSLSRRHSRPRVIEKGASHWRCLVDDIRVRFASPHESLSLVMLLRFWQQLSCIRIAHSPGSLRVDSAFSRSRAPDAIGCCFLLDGRHRCFARLPNGDPTTGTHVGGYIVGDYIGHELQGPHNLARGLTNKTTPTTMRIRCHAWPSLELLRETRGRARAFSWDFEVVVFDSGDYGRPTVDVQIRINAARVRGGQCGAWPELETLTVGARHQCIETWEHHCEVQMRYDQRSLSATMR